LGEGPRNRRRISPAKSSTFDFAYSCFRNRPGPGTGSEGPSFWMAPEPRSRPPLAPSWLKQKPTCHRNTEEAGRRRLRGALVRQRAACAGPHNGPALSAAAGSPCRRQNSGIRGPRWKRARYRDLGEMACPVARVACPSPEQFWELLGLGYRRGFRQLPVGESAVGPPRMFFRRVVGLRRCAVRSGSAAEFIQDRGDFLTGVLSGSADQ